MLEGHRKSYNAAVYVRSCCLLTDITTRMVCAEHTKTTNTFSPHTTHRVFTLSISWMYPDILQHSLLTRVREWIKMLIFNGKHLTNRHNLLQVQNFSFKTMFMYNDFVSYNHNSGSGFAPSHSYFVLTSWIHFVPEVQPLPVSVHVQAQRNDKHIWKLIPKNRISPWWLSRQCKASPIYN